MEIFADKNKGWIPVGACPGMIKAGAVLTKKAVRFGILFSVFCFVGNALPSHAQTTINHDLKVTLHPGEHSLSAIDSVTLPRDFPGEITFTLHAGLKPSSPTPLVRMNKQAAKQGAVQLDSYRVVLPPGLRAFTVTYEGTIHHPVQQSGTEQARGFSDSPGTIALDGVYLSGASGWYPDFGPFLMTFDLEVKLPPTWDCMSQGSRSRHDRGDNAMFVRWNSPEPQDSIFLIAAQFTEYSKPAGSARAMVFLRTPDEGMANKYLDATVKYLELYSGLIGPYPYKKFALVENFWETGFGMPSFTLLGPTVLRLPFIVNTSYPHEILHNWWGNSVYPDFEKGNWSEGLTAYLADHLMKELQGAGAEYRVNTLQKYADYVLGNRDFPLTQFRSRHSSSSEAIGYGKSLMFFHMLRRDLGDGTFKLGLQDFYRNNKFRFASFDDLRKSFERVSGSDLKEFFDQWVTRTGATRLALTRAVSKMEKDGNVIYLGLEQTQPGPAYRLRVPLAVTIEGRDQAYQTTALMDTKQLALRLKLPGRPVRIDIDPEFDLFRRLDRAEIPPAISQALGAKKMLIVLPSSADKILQAGYRDFAKSLAQSGPDETAIKLDSEIKALPKDRTIVILGWENRFAGSAVTAFKKYEVTASQKDIRIDKTAIARTDHSFVFTARQPENEDLALMFIASDSADALPGLGRKLPHYHKYSYLAFQGNEPSNVAKGRWTVVDSPMTVFIHTVDHTIRKVEMGKLAPREPLARLDPVYSKERMMETITFLASDELKGREIGTPEIDRAAEYIAGKFKQAGLMPGGDEGTFYQNREDPERKTGLRNVIGVIPGTKPELNRQSVVIGAHYDHLGLGMAVGRTEDKGKIHPGADDNASGVAVLVELAGFFTNAPRPDRTILFIAFSGEETGRQGSKFFTTNEKRYPASECIGMVNLDTVGRLGKNKLLVLGAGSAQEWAHIFRGAGFVTGVEIEMVSEDLDSSDQKSFHEAGVPAVQLFTGPHLDYHRATDTADKIDPDGLVKTASVAKEAVEYLAGREKPLSSPLRPGTETRPSMKSERKVGLGTVPDFAYHGRGFRLSGVVPGSPAEAAGLKQGDVIIRVNTAPIDGLRDFSDVLKTLKPGETASITYLRDGNEMKTEAVVKER